MRRQHCHRKAVITGSGLRLCLERLSPGRHVQDHAPLQLIAHGENRVEMASMERIKGTAANRDLHPRVDTVSTASCAACSRTTRASFRTNSLTPSPTTAEIS